jgi:hypothetical protein
LSYNFLDWGSFNWSSFNWSRFNWSRFNWSNNLIRLSFCNNRGLVNRSRFLYLNLLFELCLLSSFNFLGFDRLIEN